MKPDLLRFILVEDSDDDAELVVRSMRTCAKQIYFERVTTKGDMRRALEKGRWDLVISDFNLPAFSGFEAIDTLKQSTQDIPLILVSGTIGESIAVDAVKYGASDYVLKDNLIRLPTSIQHALRERKAAQDNRLLTKQLAHAQKMESIGRLAGGVAHDINNVLAAISLHAEMGVQEIESGNADAAKTTLKDILQAQQSAAGIIRQLLVFAKRQIGPKVIMDFGAVIGNMQPLLKRLIGANIDILVETPPNQPVPIAADPAQIEQIILNLAVNARDAMPSGGRIQFSLERRRIDAFPAHSRLPCAPGEFAILTAKDNGSGMSEDVLQKIFEPFFSTKEIGQGTGLGLSVIYGILQRENATMAVESQLGSGTTFQIFWPLAAAAAVNLSIVPEPPETLDARSANVLLVEDEDALRRPLAKTLRKRGFEVHEAANGIEALKILQDRTKNIDLLITDIIMPRMGGPELIDKSRELVPGLKALLLSGYASSYLQDQEFDTSSTWFLEKPFSKDSLLKKINEVLHQS